MTANGVSRFYYQPSVDEAMVHVRQPGGVRFVFLQYTAEYIISS